RLRTSECLEMRETGFSVCAGDRNRLQREFATCRACGLESRLDRLLCCFSTRLDLGVGFLRLFGALFGECAELISRLRGVEGREFNGIGSLRGGFRHRSVLYTWLCRIIS